MSHIRACMIVVYIIEICCLWKVFHWFKSLCEIFIIYIKGEKFHDLMNFCGARYMIGWYVSLVIYHRQHEWKSYDMTLNFFLWIKKILCIADYQSSTSIQNFFVQNISLTSCFHDINGKNFKIKSTIAKKKLL